MMLRLIDGTATASRPLVIALARSLPLNAHRSDRDPNDRRLDSVDA